MRPRCKSLSVKPLRPRCSCMRTAPVAFPTAQHAAGYPGSPLTCSGFRNRRGAQTVESSCTIVQRISDRLLCSARRESATNRSCMLRFLLRGRYALAQILPHEGRDIQFPKPGPPSAITPISAVGTGPRGIPGCYDRVGPGAASKGRLCANRGSGPEHATASICFCRRGVRIIRHRCPRLLEFRSCVRDH